MVVAMTLIATAHLYAERIDGHPDVGSESVQLGPLTLLFT
jgi:hypothetical protein